MLTLAADDGCFIQGKSFVESVSFTDWEDGVSFVTDANDPSQTIIKVYTGGPYDMSPPVASIALPRRIANALAGLIDVMPDQVAGCLRGERSADSESRDQDTM
jgi:hypothetical protein